jgi:rod shape-determining protein MreB
VGGWGRGGGGEFGIDLGTANTVVCGGEGTGGSGVVLDEPSVMLVGAGRQRTEAVAVGHEACALVGRSPRSVRVVRPLHDGVITDLEMARLYLRSVVVRVAPRAWWGARVRAVIGVPVGVSTLERRALLEACDEAGLSRSVSVDESIAGALGCGMDPMDRRAHMVVDVGGGTSEVSVFCYGGMLVSRSCRVAGDEMTLAVYHHLRAVHQLLVGELTAEEVKIRAGSAEEPFVVVQGRDAGTGRPRAAEVKVEEVIEVLRPVSESIIETLSGCLDELPPQAMGDVLAEGVVLFGGGALTTGFAEAVERCFGFPVRRAQRPLTCVAQGAAAALSYPELLAAYGQR